MTFVPGSHLLAATDWDGFLSLADADSGRVLWRVRAHDASINTPGVSADGRLLVTGSQDNTVRFWSLPDGRQLGPPLTFQPFPTDLQISPDGRVLAVALFSRVELWDAHTRRRLRSRHDEGRGRHGALLAKRPPDRAFQLGRRAGVVHGATGRPVTRVFSGHAGPITWDTITRDDRTLITSGLDGTCGCGTSRATRRSAHAARPARPHRHRPAGTRRRRLIAGYDTGLAYRWDIRPASLIRQACLIAGRTLTRAEWDEFLPGRDYEPACTQ